jgi:serine/threonine protein phosphatase PrpC
MGEYFYGVTDKGRVRDNNEDTFLAERLSGSTLVVACVIDGVGGYEGGEIAAETARDSITKAFSHQKPRGPEDLKEAMLLANQRVIEEKSAHKGREKMACVITLVLADIEGNQFHYSHVGDTRLYLLRGNSLVKVTKDHSFVGFLEDSSRITEENAMRHPKRNEINKALGFDPNIRQQPEYIETGTSPFLPGDLLLLCSDGLTDMIGSRIITDILTSDNTIPHKAQALVDAANEAGGRDNVTAVLVHNNKSKPPQESVAPVQRKTVERTEVSPAAIVTPVERTEERVERPIRRGAPYSLVLLLLIACGWLAFALVRQYRKTKPAPASTAAGVVSEDNSTAPPRRRNALEMQLLDSLQSGNTLLTLDSNMSGSSTPLSDSLYVQNDSLHLNGNGLVLRGDSLFQGAAIVASDSVRYLFLENMRFENFPVAIKASRAMLRLKNVQFMNCGTSVAYQFRLPASQPIAGILNGPAIFKSDSSTQRKAQR